MKFIDSEINRLQESNRRNIDFIKYYREDSEIFELVHNKEFFETNYPRRQSHRGMLRLRSAQVSLVSF